MSALLRDRKSYTAFAHGEPDIWFGKGSEASNFRYLFEQRLGRTLEREALRSRAKAIALEKKQPFSTAEVIALIKEQKL